MNLRSYVSWLWGWLLSVRPSLFCGPTSFLGHFNFCNVGLIMLGKLNSVKMAKYCEDGLILWRQPHSERPKLILWGLTWFFENGLILWSQTSLCEAAYNFVKPDLTMSSQTLLCEARPHSVRPSLILWSQCQSVRMNSSSFPQNFGLANQVRSQSTAHALYVSPPIWLNDAKVARPGEDVTGALFLKPPTLGDNWRFYQADLWKFGVIHPLVNMSEVWTRSLSVQDGIMANHS